MPDKTVLYSDFEELKSKLAEEKVIALKSYPGIIGFEQQSFPDKDSYKDLVIVQRALILLNETRRFVAVVMRASQEEQHDKVVDRKTAGASILISGSCMKTQQEILDAKVDHDNIRLHEEQPEFIAWRVAKGTRYLFLVNSLSGDLSQVRGGNDPDKTISIENIFTAADLLGDKQMECDFLSAATDPNIF